MSKYSTFCHFNLVTGEFDTPMSAILKQDAFEAFNLLDLLNVQTRPAPKDFQSFWQQAYDKCLRLQPEPIVNKLNKTIGPWQVYDVHFQSTKNIWIGGWLLKPIHTEPKRAFIVGHGYGGRTQPDSHLPFPDAAIFFPCCRGISRSPAPPISHEPQWHVLHDIDKKDQYILRGCVEDTWLSVSVIEQLFPELIGKIGYLGISFSGGIGALAMAQDKRIRRGHFNVPSFGDHRLRLRLKTTGSGESVQRFFRRHPKMLLNTIRYYDAANAASLISAPVHFALALKDPVVTPPGQFAIYNQTKAEKYLFVLDEGHGNYPTQHQQEQELLDELKVFFDDLAL